MSYMKIDSRPLLICQIILVHVVEFLYSQVRNEALVINIDVETVSTIKLDLMCQILEEVG